MNVHAPPKMTPKPFVWRDPKTIPPRQWLYGKYLIRKYVSADIAPGGVGKTSHSIVEILAMVSGKSLLGITPPCRLKVWLWNLEDPQEEVEMRIAAAAMHYGLKAEDLEGYLFINHGRETPLVIAATGRTGTMILHPVVDALVGAITEMAIDVVIADPFISSHQVTENDNNAIDMVVKEWGRVTELGNCAVRLTHHARKGEQEITADSGRGASALIAAARCARVFNRMSKEEADKAGIEDERYRSYYRTYIDKQNMAPPAERADWFHLRGVNLGNGPLGVDGDSIGVTTQWEWPEALAGVTGRDFERAAAIIRGGSWRESSQAKDWVGKAVAQAMDLDLDRKADKARVKGIVASWIKAGSLLVVERMDTGPSRHVRKWVEVAEDE